MPINDNKPTIFDVFVSEITKNLDEVLDAVRQDFNGPTEGYEEEAVPEAPHDEETTEQDEDGIDIDSEIVRLLGKAEHQIDTGYGTSGYLDIVDRLMILRREV